MWKPLDCPPGARLLGLRLHMQLAWGRSTCCHCVCVLGDLRPLVTYSCQ